MWIVIIYDGMDRDTIEFAHYADALEYYNEECKTWTCALCHVVKTNNKEYYDGFVFKDC